jgi:hypothetical protein
VTGREIDLGSTPNSKSTGDAVVSQMQKRTTMQLATSVAAIAAKKMETVREKELFELPEKSYTFDDLRPKVSGDVAIESVGRPPKIPGGSKSPSPVPYDVTAMKVNIKYKDAASNDDGGRSASVITPPLGRTTPTTTSTINRDAAAPRERGSISSQQTVAIKMGGTAFGSSRRSSAGSDSSSDKKKKLKDKMRALIEANERNNAALVEKTKKTALLKEEKTKIELEILKRPV